MKTRTPAVPYLRTITLTVAVSAAAMLWADTPTPVAPPPPSVAVVQSAYGHLPLSFEANQGQADPRVQFLAHGGGHQLLLTPSEVVLVLTTGQAKAEERKQRDAVLGTVLSS